MQQLLQQMLMLSLQTQLIEGPRRVSPGFGLRLNRT